MSGDTPIEIAARKLNAALESLEVSLGKHQATRQMIERLEEEVQALSHDRSRLAQQLDDVKERSARLEDANSAAQERVSKAATALETILGDAG